MTLKCQKKNTHNSTNSSQKYCAIDMKGNGEVKFTQHSHCVTEGKRKEYEGCGGDCYCEQWYQKEFGICNNVTGNCNNKEGTSLLVIYIYIYQIYYYKHLICVNCL